MARSIFARGVRHRQPARQLVARRSAHPRHIDSGYLGLVLYASATVLGAIARSWTPPIGTILHVEPARGVLFTSLWRFVKYAAIAAWVLVTLNGFRALRPVVSGPQCWRTSSGMALSRSPWAASWSSHYPSTSHSGSRGRCAASCRTRCWSNVAAAGVASSVSSLTYYAVLLLGLAIALAAAGFEVSQLALVVGALGVGIGFGLQNVVNNFVSGLILMFERPIQPGDVVEITGTTGTVREIGMRATMLTTGDGADAIIPVARCCPRSSSTGRSRVRTAAWTSMSVSHTAATRERSLRSSRKSPGPPSG